MHFPRPADDTSVGKRDYLLDYASRDILRQSEADYQKGQKRYSYRTFETTEYESQTNVEAPSTLKIQQGDLDF